MEKLLNAVEARILGVLIEKEMTTPDYYPLTLNALVNACNQSTNRDPVMDLSQGDVEAGLTRLRNDRLVWQVKQQGSRALKYEHNMEKIAEFSDRELAIMCVLMLRGGQTAGELRSRTTRLAEFHGLAAVDHKLQKLINHEKGAFVVRLDRRPGQKEDRYTHLLCEVAQASDHEFRPDTAEMSSSQSGGEPDPMEVLTGEIEDLRAQIEDLKAQFEEFKSQFE